MILRFLLALGLACVVHTAMAERDALNEPGFASVGDTRSINDGVVTALAQDERGLIWIGTTVGLVRYDGYQLRRVAVGAKPASGATPAGAPVGTSFVRTLLPAPGGVLWVGLDTEGLARLDTESQVWTRYQPDPKQAGALTSGSVRALARDHDGALWVGTTGGGLHRLAPQGTTFENYRRASGALPDDRVQALLVDRRGDLWVGTWNGLVRLRRGSQQFESVASDPSGSGGLAGRIVATLVEAPDGRIWAGTRQGELVLIDPHNGESVQAQSATDSADNRLSGATRALTSMVVASPDEIWVASTNGVELRDSKDGHMVMRLVRDARKPWSLAANNVVALLRERSGGLWLGSYGGGLQRHNPSSGLWVRRAEVDEASILANADVRSLHQLHSGEIWVGLNEGGIAVLDTQLRLIDQILSSALFKNGMVGAMAQSTDGSVWVGTDSGVYQFSPQRKLLASYRAGQGRARRMVVTADGSVWVGTQDGVYRLRPGGERFDRLNLHEGGALNGNVNALAEAGDGSLWVGSGDGLWVVPQGGADLQAVTSPPGQGLPQASILGLLVDKQQALWVDTSAGLYRMAGRVNGQASFKHMADASGGSMGANLLDDALGRIWTHQNVFDPRDGSRYELSAADGVDMGTGWFRSYTRLADGRLLFGGSTGMLVVQPERFEPWAYAPALVVSELRVADERVPSATALTLTPQQRNFSVEFSALDFSSPERLRYRYRLQGFDTAWIETGADFRVASYGNLPPGEYGLEVQGTNRIGQWSPQTLRLGVTVQPAWWQTWWAQALAVAAGVLAVLGVVHLRTAVLRRRQVELEAKVYARTLELENLSRELQVKSEALEASSLTDPLTGLHNRRFLNQYLDAEIAQVLRIHEEHRQQGVALGDGADIVFFILDIDHFKQVNDQYGHAAGDAVLVEMRQRLQLAFRQADYLVRWGGEEFLIVARATSRAQAPELAERARAAVANTPFLLADGVLLHRTCSIGFAVFPLAPQWPAALEWPAVVNLADQALYAVKNDGRNGWLGLLEASADSPGALRDAARQPLAQWVASGNLKMAGAPGHAAIDSLAGPDNTS